MAVRNYTKNIPPRQETQTAAGLPIIERQWAFSKTNVKRVFAAMAAASGRDQVDIFELDQLRVGAGGNSVFMVATPLGPQPKQKIEGILVHHHAARAYWSQPFGAGTRQPPQCQSPDGVQGFGDPGGLCLKCPHAVFGTKPAQGGGQGRAPACKNMHILYVLYPYASLPAVLPVPGMSITPAREYLRWLAKQGYFAHEVLTEIGQEQARSADGITYSKLTFTCLGLLSEDTQKQLEAYSTEVKAAVKQPLLAAAASPAGGVTQASPLFSEEEIRFDPDTGEIENGEEDDLPEPEVHGAVGYRP